MACTDNVCGTGDWAGPLPGDPDNNSVLSATPAYGGIDVSWSLPTLNTHAVIHTHVFRGITPDFELSTRRTVEGGNSFFDRIPKEDIRQYFYWIRIVSVNGTVGDPIGPASAVPMSSIEETLRDLTGLIDAGVLAKSLRTEIERVEILNQRIYQEELDRKSQSNILTTALSEVQADGDALTALLQQEVALRISNNEALAASLTTTQAELEGNLATVQTSLQSNINTVNGKVTNIGALYTAKVGVNGLIGGFGVYNDGTEVEAGFDVDRFWIGKAGQAIKPFMVDGGTVYINNAMIHQAVFDTATFRGNLNVRSATSGARMEITNRAIKVYNDAGVVQVQIGDLSA